MKKFLSQHGHQRFLFNVYKRFFIFVAFFTFFNVFYFLSRFFTSMVLFYTCLLLLIVVIYAVVVTVLWRALTQREASLQRRERVMLLVLVAVPGG